MQHLTEMRRCLEECDVQTIRALWRHISPHLPQPKTDKEALIAIHVSRTQMNSLPFKLRAYSHSWLVERNLPTALPDKLRPKAERLYPPNIEAVGVAVLTACRSKDHAENVGLGLAVRTVMSNVAEDYYATDRLARPDPQAVKRDMLQQRREFMRRVVDIAMSGWRRL